MMIPLKSKVQYCIEDSLINLSNLPYSQIFQLIFMLAVLMLSIALYLRNTFESLGSIRGTGSIHDIM